MEQSRMVLSTGGEIWRVCVTLGRRPDRWAAFHQRCPLADVERFAAVDGRVLPNPSWWRQGGGAWGCLRSHMRILEQAIERGLDRRDGVVVVFEDDAVFCDQFPARAASFFAALPSDWEQVYLGGQHRGKHRPPEPVNAEVMRCRKVNRTHAYAIRGAFIRELYRHLCDWPAHATKPRHHVDHRMELLHERHRVYAPTEWLVGQAAGQSDISGRVSQDRYWHRPHVIPPVWVIGLHRSGSSVTAGILHRIGVHMGNRLGGYERKTGGFEAHGLAQLCEQAFPFPQVERAVPIEITRDRLRRWTAARQAEAAHRDTRAGGKYPHLCLLMDLLPADSRIVHIDRPIDESIESLMRRSRNATRPWLRAAPDQCDQVQRALWRAKREGLARFPADQVITVDYADLLALPEREASRIAEFLGLSVGDDQLRRAASIVQREPRRGYGVISRHSPSG